MASNEQFEQEIIGLLRGTLSPQHVKEATKALKKALKRPATLIVLLKLATENEDPNVSARAVGWCALRASAPISGADSSIFRALAARRCDGARRCIFDSDWWRTGASCRRCTRTPERRCSPQ